MTSKFDPVAFWNDMAHKRFHRGLIFGENSSAAESIRALAAEAAKQQAIRDAEICREYPKRDPAEDGNGYWAANDCAQAIEREAGL